jgi:mono/diheme cytochrome c family protein
MNDQEKQEYLEKYKRAKNKGLPFYPDVIFKDAVISLLIFLILVGLAYFIGAPLEPRADPADTTYTPRPEWYFLFLFQLLKYFPGRLEFLGVVLLPTVVVLLLFFLPLLDRSPKRHILGRPIILGVTIFAVLGVVTLTVQSYREAPPPEEAAQGDQVAALYAEDCAGCHGTTITVGTGINLHSVIAQGKHEGMPAWSADLSTDQIDALVGFILSPVGSTLFSDQCGSCHEVSELVAGNPLELKSALDKGSSYPPHADVEVPDWSGELSQENRIALLNFLVAPDGQRLYAINCSPCHGLALDFSGEEDELETIIRKGGLHLEMPPWQEELKESEINILARYVVDPSSITEGKELFEQYCSACHGDRIPVAEEFSQAQDIIAGGGSHQVMPIWGDLLTDEQLAALVSYTMNVAKGNSLGAGQELFATNCASCHGDFGEGGQNPARQGDIIAPISSVEYLKTRDDFTLRTIISQGQPNFGMSPFGSSAGGPLDDDDIDAIVAFMRAWEQNPPVDMPPEVTVPELSINGMEIYTGLCAQCHGGKGQGGLGPALNDPQFQTGYSDQDIFDAINLGHAGTSMIVWGEILNVQQIQQLVEIVRQLEPPESTTGTETPTDTTAPTFANDILPIFEAKCKICHGTMGGWDGTSYESTITSGDHAPVVIPGDPDTSLLAQKLLNTQSIGAIMPPGGKLADSEIQLILGWIIAGALEK